MYLESCLMLSSFRDGHGGLSEWEGLDAARGPEWRNARTRGRLEARRRERCDDA